MGSSRKVLLSLIFLILSNHGFARSTAELVSAYQESDGRYSVRCSNHQYSNEFELVEFSDLSLGNICPYVAIEPEFSSIIKTSTGEFDIICSDGTIKNGVNLSNLIDVCGGSGRSDIAVNTGLNEIIYADMNSDQSFDIYCANGIIENSSYGNLISGNICPIENNVANIRFIRKNPGSSDYKIICTSGKSFPSGKKSDFATICREDEHIDHGLFSIVPVSQYFCVSLKGTEDLGNGNFDYKEFVKNHFYYPAYEKPAAIPYSGYQNVVCHDVNQYGVHDSMLFPRLGLRPAHLAMWNVKDSRFVDMDFDGYPDINYSIENELKKVGAKVNGRQIFSYLYWKNMPEVFGLPESSTAKLGVFMQPWVDEDNNGFCPGLDDLTNGDNPVFKELGKYISETEAIYMAESEFLYDPNNSFISDILLISETDLSKIWFYYENGQHMTPDKTTAASKTIHFYWPVDFNNPYIKMSDSLLYTIRTPSEPTLTPPDRRFGCIPKFH